MRPYAKKILVFISCVSHHVRTGQAKLNAMNRLIDADDAEDEYIENNKDPDKSRLVVSCSYFQRSW